MAAELKSVFQSLRGILVRKAGSLLVADDTATRYCLGGRVGPATVRAWGGKRKRETIPVAWVEIGRSYVSFHLMSVYGDPKSREGLSKELRQRMQGKACFNFNHGNEALFQELEELTSRGLEAFRNAGFIQ